MPLNKTEEDLYDPNSNIEDREHSKSAFDIDDTVNNTQGVGEKFKEEGGGWKKDKDLEVDKGRKKVMIIGGAVLGAILIISISVVAFAKFKQTAFSQSRVTINIDGNTAVKSGQDVSYVIKYENNNRTALENVEITLNHSENFYPEENGRLVKYSDRSSKIIIGDVGARAKGEIEVSGKFYAAEDYTIYLQPVFIYKPTTSSSEFRSETQFSVKITTSPVSIEIDAPKEALSESTAEYEIKYKNTGTVPFDSLNLRLSYSEGFIFQGAEPAPIEKDNVWHIGRLNPGDGGTIKMKGKIEGNQFDVKSIKATLFRNESDRKEIVFGKAEGITKVVVPPLAITHKINDQDSLNINLGDDLMYKINYTNNGKIALRDIIIKLKIDSPIVDYGGLFLRDGAYESETKTITWRASDVAQLENLEPGDSGLIELQVPIKDKADINNSLDKNFTIESIVTIDSSDVAFHSLGASKNISNKVIAKLNSRVILEQEAFYNDSFMDNFGPIPPKVGEETSYAIHWKITNVSNDISDTRVKTYLPTWVKWKGEISPDSEKIEFNERTHEIVWNVGSLDNAVGILNDPREVVFQVSILPEINQVDNDIILISEAELTARDNFTSNFVTEVLDKKTTRIEEDESVDSTGYRVVE